MHLQCVGVRKKTGNITTINKRITKGSKEKSSYTKYTYDFNHVGFNHNLHQMLFKTGTKLSNK